MRLLTNRSIQRNSYIWNLMACLLTAFQSTLCLMVITRTVGLMYAGIFTIAYSLGTQLLIVGKYNMRNYQVTDTLEEHSFKEYLYSRIFTTIIMMFLGILYVVFGSISKDYTVEKIVITIFILLAKAVDSIEDVYHGLYQQKGRLDIAAKQLSTRTFLYICVFFLMIIISSNLMFSLVISGGSTIIICYIFLKSTIKQFYGMKERANLQSIKQILGSCFPLFVGGFCSIYSINAPKYALDGLFSEEIQAIYGFISMPILFIYTTSTAILQPEIVFMSNEWKKKNIKQFMRRIYKRFSVVAVMSVGILAGGYFFGTHILSLIYGVDLNNYRTDLFLILLGSSILTFSSVFSIGLTIIRKQNFVLVGYVTLAVMAYCMTPKIVALYSMRGAIIIFLFLRVVEFILFFFLFLIGLKKARYSVEV